MKKKYKELTKNTLIFSIGLFGSKLILFFMIPLYTHTLTVEEYGTADLVQTMATLFIPIFSIVIQDSVLRFGLSENINKEVILKNSFFIVTICCGIGIIFSSFLKMYSAISNWIVYLYLVIITNIFSNILLAYIKSKNKNILYSLSSILNTLVLVSSNLFFLIYLKLGIKGYLCSIILSHCFVIVFLFFKENIYIYIYQVKLDFKLLKQMIFYSAPLVVNNLSWWILNASDKIMIERYNGVADLGLYTIASKIPALISVINSIFLQAWTISSIKDYEKNKDKSFFASIFKFYSITMFLVVSFLLLILKNLMFFYVGIRFQQAWNYVPLLLFGSIFYGFSLFFGVIYSAVKKNIQVAISTLIASAINIIINLILLPKIGVIVASFSTAISYFVLGIYRMFNSRYIFSFDISKLKFLLNCFICFIQCILVTIDFKVFYVSLIAILLLILNNYKDILLLPKFILDRNKK